MSFPEVVDLVSGPLHRLSSEVSDFELRTVSHPKCPTSALVFCPPGVRCFGSGLWTRLFSGSLRPRSHNALLCRLFSTESRRPSFFVRIVRCDLKSPRGPLGFTSFFVRAICDDALRGPASDFDVDRNSGSCFSSARSHLARRLRPLLRPPLRLSPFALFLCLPEVRRLRLAPSHRLSARSLRPRLPPFAVSLCPKSPTSAPAFRTVSLPEVSDLSSGLSQCLFARSLRSRLPPFAVSLCLKSPTSAPAFAPSPCPRSLDLGSLLCFSRDFASWQRRLF